MSRWLNDAGLAVVRALDDVPQPTIVDRRPVTWWEQLPEHRPARTAELGAVLKALHALDPPTNPTLLRFDPFTGLDQRIAAARHLDLDDRHWLTQRLAELRDRLDNLRLDELDRVVHGDAWQGNVAVDDTLRRSCSTSSMSRAATRTGT